MSKSHQHTPKNTSKASSLLIPLIMTSAYFLVELIGGFITQSLALISDAAHMFTDVTALAIAFAALKISEKTPDNKRTFGYERFEILAAAFNTILLFMVAFYILYEAYLRLNKPPEIESTGMLVIASIGLLVNVISMYFLHQDKDENLNLKGAYLEVWSDTLGSAGVIIGALLIQFLGFLWIDSLIAVLIGCWILPRAWTLLKASVNILLEGVPKHIEIKKIKARLTALNAVEDLHELHVWAISTNKVSLTAHIVTNKNTPHTQLIQEINTLLKTEFNISHTTLQLEHEKCLDEAKDCYFHK